MKDKPVAIIDIGSNSVRLVVYSGPSRVPSVLFNEKVMAGLGRDLGRTGEISAEARDSALEALQRFRILTRKMGVGRIRAVATAAVREASNGDDFLARVRAAGFQPRVLSGEEEGVMAGQGVLSAIPDADGIVGDLGGGSLELVDVADHAVRASQSLPLGVLRLVPLLEKSEGAIAKKVKKALADCDFRKSGRRRPFYLVGGSWRALARLDMLLTDYPLPITHQYALSPDRLPELRKAVEELDKADLKSAASVSASRIPTLPHALALLGALVDELKPSELVVSAFGIREGLLYDDLQPDVRRLDPLIEAARDAGSALGRFAEHGALIDRWIAPVFDDDVWAARLRLTACLLSDIGWSAHPDFRAERGVDMALHGNWVGVDLPGRVMIAQALYTNFGGGTDFSAIPASRLCSAEQLQRAAQWGLAMRLAQRFSGGVAAPLEHSQLAIRNGALRLILKRGDQGLYGEPVERRLNTLASALGFGAEAVAA